MQNKKLIHRDTPSIKVQIRLQIVNGSNNKTLNTDTIINELEYLIHLRNFKKISKLLSSQRINFFMTV